jgi:hypothetical protein
MFMSMLTSALTSAALPGRAQFLEHRPDVIERFAIAAAHQVERPLARLRDRRGHARFDGTRVARSAAFVDAYVRRRRDGRAVHEDRALRGVQKRIGLRVLGENRVHRRVVAHDRDDDVGVRRHLAE